MPYSKKELEENLKKHLVFLQFEGKENLLEKELSKLTKYLIKDTDYYDHYDYYLDNENSYVKKVMYNYCPYSNLTKKYIGNDWSFLSHLSINVAETVKEYITEKYSNKSFMEQWSKVGQKLETINEMLEVIDFFENVPLFLVNDDNTSDENLYKKKIRILKNNLRYHVSLFSARYNISSELSKHILNNDLDTILVRCNNREVKIFKFILERYEYMKILIDGKFKDSDIFLDVDNETFESFISFICSGTIDIDNIEDKNFEYYERIYKFADNYCIEDLKNICELVFKIFECKKDGSENDCLKINDLKKIYDKDNEDENENENENENYDDENNEDDEDDEDNEDDEETNLI